MTTSDTPPPLPPLPSSGEHTTGTNTPKTSEPSRITLSAYPTPSAPLPSEVLAAPKEDLQTILDSTFLQDALIYCQHPQSKGELDKPAEMLLEEALKRSEALEKKRESLEELHRRVTAAALEAKTAEDDWQKCEKEMYIALRKCGGSALGQKLSAGVAESERICEGLSASFLESNAGSDEIIHFIRDYRRERQLFYLRQERKQRWDEERVAGRSTY
ncbi:hypothetical protein CANCADRAFT_3788 [Tortispora caseinolytica NRRL Y-17796]|uniref:VPS37 C-terminal domain-containing protein n=1 Tax=Tortispora caseinolytica NRRL Y-17796 TaxID=767744 RepID=A0A1E4TBM3_9ASCO|nr:hypothetical protein CANCADRAFT_3788 [Tortispora caseinolytica NRRL Y-17796]